jgi:hypothetical protein
MALPTERESPQLGAVVEAMESAEGLRFKHCSGFLCAGVVTRQEGTQLLLHLPQPQLVAMVEAMDSAMKSQIEASLDVMPRVPSPHRGSLRR